MDIADGRLRGRSVARDGGGDKSGGGGSSTYGDLLQKTAGDGNGGSDGLVVAKVSGIRKEARASSCRHEADAMGFRPLETTLGLARLRGMRVTRSRKL